MLLDQIEQLGDEYAWSYWTRRDVAQAIGSALAGCSVLDATVIGPHLADDIVGPVPAHMEVEDLEALGDGEVAQGSVAVARLRAQSPSPLG